MKVCRLSSVSKRIVVGITYNVGWVNDLVPILTLALILRHRLAVVLLLHHQLILQLFGAPREDIFVQLR